MKKIKTTKKITNKVSHSNGGTPAQFLKILDLHKQGISIRDIASIVNKPRSTVHRWIKKKEMGQMGSGVSQTKFEIHNYQSVLKILERPLTWSPNTILHLKKIKFDIIKRNGWEEFYFAFNDCSVHITPHSIIVFPPKIQSKVNIIDAKVMATQTVLDIIPRIEQLLEIKISSRQCTFITISRQHSAMINEEVWNTLKKAGFQKVKDEKGNIRLMLDESGEKHIESTHPQFSDGDIDHFNTLIKETVIGGCSFYKTNSAVLTTQKAILSMNERVARLEGELGHQPTTTQNREKDPSYIG